MRDRRVYEYMVRRLLPAKKLDWIEEILGDQKQYLHSHNEGYAARLISLYGQAGLLDHARKVFDEMPNRGLVSFNALLAACLHSKKFGQVNLLFNELPENLSIKPDAVSYNTLIKAYCEMGSLDSARLVLDEMEKMGLKPDLFSYNPLLDAFYKNGKLVDGESIWNRMVEKNVAPDTRSYNAKLSGLAKEERTEEIVKVFEEMKAKDVEPDAFSFNSLFRGFVAEGNVEQVKSWYNKMRKAKCLPDRGTFQLLVSFLCENGEAYSAFEICCRILSKKFSRMFRFDEKLLQLVVDELVKCSKIEEAKKLVELGDANEFHDYALKLPSA